MIRRMDFEPIFFSRGQKATVQCCPTLTRHSTNSVAWSRDHVFMKGCPTLKWVMQNSFSEMRELVDVPRLTLRRSIDQSTCAPIGIGTASQERRWQGESCWPSGSGYYQGGQSQRLPEVDNLQRGADPLRSGAGFTYRITKVYCSRFHLPGSPCNEYDRNDRSSSPWDL